MFAKTDVGCYADGAFGHQHVVNKVVALAVSEGFDCDANLAEGFEMLDPEVVDLICDDALEVLNAACDEDVYFEFYEGSLVLLEVAEGGYYC